MAKNLAPSLVPGQTQVFLSQASSFFTDSVVQFNVQAPSPLSLVVQSQMIEPFVAVHF